ncbi:MAG: type 1 glutamine amidotransferase [Propionibacteriaceae bacterium]
MAKNILVLQHELNCGPGRFGTWLTEAGATLTVIHGPSDRIPGDLDRYDALIVLGGSMNANQDESYPWLGPVKMRIKEALSKEIPLFGICLGHQLISVATGGVVEPQGHTTIGLAPFLRTPAGRKDKLFADLADPVVAVHYNGDTVTTLPEGAIALAHTSDGSIAAARFAPYAWGVQFHPEVTAEGFAEWTSGKDDEQRPELPVSVDDVARAVIESEEVMCATWKPVALGFFDIIG